MYPTQQLIAETFVTWTKGGTHTSEKPPRTTARSNRRSGGAPGALAEHPPTSELCRLIRDETPHTTTSSAHNQTFSRPRSR